MSLDSTPAAWNYAQPRPEKENTLPEEQTKALPLTDAYTFATNHGLAREADEIRNMAIDGFKNQSSVRRGHMLKLLEDRGLLEEFKGAHWIFGKTREGEAKCRLYRRLHEQHQRLLARGDSPEEAEVDTDTEGEPTSDQAFAYESDLRDFLANNLSVIEPGLHLHEQGGQTGVEFPIEGGYIDILAKDRDERFVVIELKLSRGRNRTIGQLLYYMGWIDQHLGGAGSSRGMIIARDITDDLLVATSRVPSVSLFQYRMSVTVEPVSASNRDRPQT
jgi:hypothetical protein